MDRPKRMANTMMGRNGRIGPVAVTPIRPAPAPLEYGHRDPSAAPRLSKDVTAPIRARSTTGTGSSRRRIRSPTTTARKTGRLSESTVVKSAVTAVVPPT